MRRAAAALLLPILLGCTTAAPERSAVTASPRAELAAAVHAPGAPACSGKPVRFARDVEPIFMSGCSGEYCHGVHVNTPAHAYEYWVNQPSMQCEGRTLVLPGHPEQSYLIEKVAGDRVCAGTPMPRGTNNTLRPDEIQVLYDWICQGARRD